MRGARLAARISRYGVLIVTLLVFLSDGVSEVSKQELQEKVKDSKETVVYFYAKWCRLCDTFDSVFDAAAIDYARPGELEFIKFDGGRHREFAAPIINDSFPGVALFNGSALVDHMRAIKTRENLERWIEEMTGESVEIFDTKEAAEKRAKKFVVAFIASVPSISSNIFNVISEVASSHRQWAKWLVVIDPSLTSVGHITVKHPYEKQKSLEKFITTDELKQWAENNRFPLFGLMDASNQNAYYETGRNPAMFIGTDKDFKQHGIVFRKLAVAFKKDFSFVWFQSNQEGAHSTLSDLMVRSIPALVVFTGTGNRREHKRFVYSGQKTDIADFEKMSQFLTDVLAKKVRPTVRSMPRPSESQIAGKRVKPVSATGFEELVLHDNKDFMLVLTAPKGNDMLQGCVTCQPVVQMLEKMASIIERELSRSMIEFGEFPVTDNEMPMLDWGGTWEFDQLPVIYLIKAGARMPIEYKGNMTSASILEFWEYHTDILQVKQKRLSLSIANLLDLNQAKREEL